MSGGELPPNWRPEWQLPKRLRGKDEKPQPAPLEAPGSTLWGCYLWLDAWLVDRGWPATSPFWLAEVQRFLEGGKRQAVFRVGRRGGKTTTMCRLLIVVTLWGGHVIPPGDVGYGAVVSVTRTHAEDILRVLIRILEAMGVTTEPLGGSARGVLLPGRQLGIRVFAASLAGVVGFTCVCAICDEVARWYDKQSGVNPASEVLASLRPTLATQLKGRLVLISSPLGELDAHADAYRDGDNEYQDVAHAPTWVANPTITEEQTHQEERNPDKWRREYGAIPLEGTLQSLFTPAMLDKCARPERDVIPEAGVEYAAAMDPGMARNAWTFAISGKRLCPDGKVKRSVVLVREWRGTREAPLDSDTIISAMAPIMRKYGVTGIYSDQYEQFSLRSIASRYGLDLWVPKLTVSQRVARFESMVVEMLDGAVELPADKTLRADMLSARLKLTTYGFTVDLPETPDGRHADYVPAVTLALDAAELEPDVTKSRYWKAGPPKLVAVKTSQEQEDEIEAQIDAEMEADERGDPFEREFARRGCG